MDYENREHSEPEEVKEVPLSELTLVTEFDPKRRELAIAYTRTSRRYGFRLMLISFIISVYVLLSKITVFFTTYTMNSKPSPDE